tara:strand:+ start:479 stop:676 length:198 start_codon:yes stop_codon:yes gene_type:complete
MNNEYSSITTAIQEILNKDMKTIKKDIEENDTVTTGDVQIQDRPLLKKKKDEEEIFRRQAIKSKK